MSDERIILTGRAIPYMRDDVDTDAIIPARFLKEMDDENYWNYAFIDERHDPDGNLLEHVFNQYLTSNNILLVGSNFGIGSSRQHAAEVIRLAAKKKGDNGIQAIVGVSYGDIFAGNCKNIGIPAVMADRDYIDTLANLVKKSPEIKVSLDLHGMVCTYGGGISFPINIDEGRRTAFLTGKWDPQELLLENIDKCRARGEKILEERAYFGN